jgi:AAA+ ATPase superfamily predicted ATPase
VTKSFSSAELSPDTLSPKPLIAIDQILQRIPAGAQEYSVKPLIDLFCEKLLNLANVHAKAKTENARSSFFQEEIPWAVKQIAAAALLRLVSKCTLQDAAFRVRCFDLFDRIFGKDLYPQIGLSPKTQNYEKEASLKSVLEELEGGLEAIVSQAAALVEPNPAGIAALRQQLTKSLNSTKARALVIPFLPKDLGQAPTSQIFVEAGEFVESSDTAILQQYDHVRHSLDSYALTAEEHGTTYSRVYLGGIARQLHRICEIHFRDSNASKPAQLYISASEKKYPLGTPNTPVSLSFQIKNEGPGTAFNVCFLIRDISETVSVQKIEYYMGNLAPRKITVDVSATVKLPSRSITVLAECTWTNFSGDHCYTEEMFELSAQRSDVNWSDLAKQQPYSLDPIEDERNLVGRSEILNRLTSSVTGQVVSSACVFGQKRVGKTSIVKTLVNRLKADSGNVTCIYMESGDYIHPDPKRTIEQLGDRIWNEVRFSDQRLTHLPKPQFDGALSAITPVFSQISQIAPDKKFVFILDEFDELPPELYKRGEIGDAFFLTVRSISNKANFGFILVGGEKMRFVLSCQGDTLNKFQSIPVDYFDREKHWSDFVDLVTRRVSDWLEVSDSALQRLYEYCAGNPFFTTLVCRSLFSLMVEETDCHATEVEVDDAVERELGALASNSFQHFWEDGIFETGDRAEEVSMRRRKVLLALADILRQTHVAHQKDIFGVAQRYDLDEVAVRTDLQEFTARNVLVCDRDTYVCKVKLFESWLTQVGPREIITTFTDLDAILERRKQEELAQIRPDEIQTLVRAWRIYKGSKIGTDDVRGWLAQFGSAVDQRLMLSLLRNLRFYSEDLIRAKLRDAHGIVSRGLVQRLEHRQRKRDDIVVSYLDRVSKSGCRTAQLYLDENEIYVDNMLEKGSLTEEIKKFPSCKALVFVDDFVGTGNSASEYLTEISEQIKEIARTRTVFFLAIAGFADGKKRIQETAKKLGIDLAVHLCDILDHRDRCFEESSTIYPNNEERIRARAIAYEFGSKLEKNAPLGYGSSQAAVVFAYNCPNNTLPILWSGNATWVPLFRRD